MQNLVAVILCARMVPIIWRGRRWDLTRWDGGVADARNMLLPHVLLHQISSLYITLFGRRQGSKIFGFAGARPVWLWT